MARWNFDWLFLLYIPMNCSYFQLFSYYFQTCTLDGLFSIHSTHSTVRLARCMLPASYCAAVHGKTAPKTSFSSTPPPPNPSTTSPCALAKHPKWLFVYIANPLYRRIVRYRSYCPCILGSTPPPPPSDPRVTIVQSRTGSLWSTAGTQCSQIAGWAAGLAGLGKVGWEAEAWLGLMAGIGGGLSGSRQVDRKD